MNLNVDLPALDTEQLLLRLRNLSFDLGNNNKFRVVVRTEGLEEMKINANIKSGIDLATLDAALGLKDIELKGLTNTDIQSNGIFTMNKKLFPKTKGFFSLKTGWLKTKYYPNAIQHQHSRKHS